MPERALGFVYIGAAIVLTVYGQLVVKWQVNVMGVQPTGLGQNLDFLFRMVTNPWVLSGFAAAFGAAMAWMLAVSRLNLNYAYPFMSVTFPTILLCSYLLFKEPVRLGNIFGVGLIVLGIIIHSRA
jgi:multidrug transporter EmrE-like cation transporter